VAFPPDLPAFLTGIGRLLEACRRFAPVVVGGERAALGFTGRSVFFLLLLFLLWTGFP